MLDEFRLYHTRHPIVVKHHDIDRRYHLYFNEPIHLIKTKLYRYPTFIDDPWMIDQEDFDCFVKYSRIHCVEIKNNI